MGYPSSPTTWRETTSSVHLAWDTLYRAVPTQSSTPHFLPDGIGASRVDTLVSPGSSVGNNSGYYLINQSWFTGSTTTEIAWIRCLFVRGTGSAPNQYIFQNLVNASKTFGFRNTSLTAMQWTLNNTADGGDNFSVNFTGLSTGSCLADLFYEYDRGAGNTICWGFVNGQEVAVTGTGLTPWVTQASADDFGILGNRIGDQCPLGDFKLLGIYYQTGSTITLAEHLADYSASCVI